LRYSGKAAAFLRGFRAVYLGVFFNVVIMATVSLAAIKIGSVMFGVDPVSVVVVAGTVTVIYALLGGLTGVLITDLIQFGLALGGAFAAAYFAVSLPEVGGLSGLMAHENVAGKLNVFPSFSTIDPDLLITIFIIPLAVQWWSTWYPGAEPGGGGYVAQRMLAAKDERHSMGATLFFNVAHYAVRPWPWIIVALASLIVFPDVASIGERFPNVDPSVLGNDLAYPAMLTFLPTGLLGLVVASLIAAYMSTISTHLNWGSSYVVNDVYQRFIDPNASEKKKVMWGRISTAVLMFLALMFALQLENALDAFGLLLQIGAGTGLLFLLRWFWWRINAASEIVAMVVSFLIALVFFGIDRGWWLAATEIATWQRLITGVVITTLAWVATAFLTRPTSQERLREFYEKIQPGRTLWGPVIDQARHEGQPIDDKPRTVNVGLGIVCALLGSVFVYSVLFATGSFLYGEAVAGTVLTIVALLAAVAVWKLWPNVSPRQAVTPETEPK
jgi:Na+/proline symporter